MQSGKGKTDPYAIFLSFQPSSITLRQHFSHKFYGRTSIHPQDVRPQTLRTYVHTPFGRTFIHPLVVRPYILWSYVHTPLGRTCIDPQDVRAQTLGRTSIDLRTYVHRNIHLRKREIVSQNRHFMAHESRILARKGILGRKYRSIRGYWKSKK